MNIEELITEMKAVKATHSELEIQEILRIFNIAALKELSIQIQKVGANHGR